MKRRIRAFLIGMTTLALLAGRTAAGEFIRIETPLPFFLTFAANIAANGSVAVGDVNGTTLPGYPATDVPGIYWSQEHGRTLVPPIAPYRSNTLGDVSGDGTTFVGNLAAPGNVSASYRWTEAGGYEFLEIPEGFNSVSMRAISNDGSVLAGFAFGASNSSTVLWREGAEVQVLPSEYGSPQAISADGTRVQLLRGTYFLSGEFVPNPPQIIFARGITADGNVAIGVASTGEAARWTIGGEVEGLGFLPGFSSSTAWAVSADGKVVLGQVVQSTARAFVWDEYHGMRELEQVIPHEYGIETHPWGLQNVRGISDDRMTITGYSRSNRAAEGSDGEMWVIKLDWPIGGAPGDFNFDGQVDGADFLVWQRNVGQLAGATPYNGDANYDRRVDHLDLALWKANALGASGPIAAAVPEPIGAAPVLIGLALCGHVSRLPRRRRCGSLAARTKRGSDAIQFLDGPAC